MKRKKIIDEILKCKEFISNPPVLIDIGASGNIHRDWKLIAKYSICIAFDADDRELEYFENEQKGFKKLILINKIISDQINDEIDFYLTKSPFCSSALEPDIESLENWFFYDLFKVEKKVKLKNVNFSTVFEQLEINYIDWFKTDSQGIDLRLFKSIGAQKIDKVLIAEFEPGIIDAYKGEDKLYSILEYMDKKNFWLSSMQILGTYRISRLVKEKYGKIIKKELYPSSACWASPVYINNFSKISDKRSLLLGCALSIIKRQYGFALELVYKAENIDLSCSVFKMIEKYLLKKIKKNQKRCLFLKIVDKIYNTVFK